MSDDTYRQVRGKVEIAGDDLGPQTLKNIAEPMRTWRVQLGGQSAAKAQSGSPAGQAPALALPDKALHRGTADRANQAARDAFKRAA